jgi:hypothetical protein
MNKVDRDEVIQNEKRFQHKHTHTNTRRTIIKSARGTNLNNILEEDGAGRVEELGVLVSLSARGQNVGSQLAELSTEGVLLYR